MIRSRQNQTIKTIRRLRRRQGDHALLEGPHLVREALESGLALDVVLATPAFLARDEAREVVARLSPPPLEIADAVLEELCDADTPRGILALARLARGGAESLPVAAAGLYLYLDGIQEPGNLGAIARAAEAFGATALALSPACAHPNHPRALRASAGSLLRMPAARDVAIAQLDERLSADAPIWVGLVAHGGATLPALPSASARVLALGSEGGGLSAATEARLDRRWTLPLRPPVESLNVAVAAGIALYAIARAAHESV